MKKYGFVYIWRDRKHNRYYVGAHWGTEEDGYICSSPWLLKAYKRRPSDFKRRILERIYTNRIDTFNAEQKWLDLIKEHEIKSRYYNLNIKVSDYWHKYEDKRLTISEKIAIKTKEAMQKPEVKAKYKESLKKRNCRSFDPEVLLKKSISMKKTMAKKFPVENRYKPLSEEERKQYYSNKAKQMHASRSPEKKLEIAQKIVNANLGKKMRLGQTNSEAHRKKISEALKGKIHHRHKIMIDNVVYDSSIEASKTLNISVATINRRLNSNKYENYLRLKDK